MLQHEIIHKIMGNPRFWGIPIVMTSRSHKNVIISPKKSENEMCERFHGIAQPHEEEGKPS